MNKAPGKKNKACYIYYQHFSALLYREAMVMKNEGYDVDIICLRGPGRYKYINHMDGLTIYCIQTRLSAEKKTCFYLINLARFFIKAFFLVTLQGVIKRYKIIHVTAPPDIMVFSSIMPKIIGSKIILDIHDIGPELYMRKLNVREDAFIIKAIKYMERISCQFSDYVISVTDFWCEKLKSRSVPSQKCKCILNVPDESIFNTKNQKNKEKSGAFNLYYHGSLEEHFGVDTMINAMSIVKEKIPQIKLHIYSSKKGRIIEQLKELVYQQNAQEIVTFHNGVPFYELPDILIDADIGIVPTKGNTFSDEAISMKSFEYLALGIPIVISGTKAHRFYYNSSMVKFFEPENSLDLARGVIELYENNAKRNQLIVEGIRFIENYGWKKAKQEYKNIIRELSS